MTSLASHCSAYLKNKDMTGYIAATKLLLMAVRLTYLVIKSHKTYLIKLEDLKSNRKSKIQTLCDIMEVPYDDVTEKPTVFGKLYHGPASMNNPNLAHDALPKAPIDLDEIFTDEDRQFMGNVLLPMYRAGEYKIPFKIMDRNQLLEQMNAPFLFEKKIAATIGMSDDQLKVTVPYKFLRNVLKCHFKGSDNFQE